MTYLQRIMVLFTALLLMPLSPHGDEIGDQAQRLFQAGAEKFKDGSYESAADDFRAAFELKPSYKILYNIGQSEAAAKRYGVALDAFERYLIEGGDDIDSERQRQIQEEIVRLRVLTGIIQVSAPAGTLIFIDDLKRGALPARKRIPVSAMKLHKVRAVLGDAEIEKEVTVSGGDIATVDMTALEPDSVETERAAQPTDAEAEPEVTDDNPSSMETKNKRLFVSGLAIGAVGVGALIGGSVCGGLFLSYENELKSQCDGLSCDETERSLLDKRDRMALSSTVLWAAGGTLTAGGLVLLLVSRLKKESDKTAVLLPVPGGLVVKGEF